MLRIAPGTLFVFLFAVADTAAAASFVPVAQARELHVSAIASIPITFFDDGSTLDLQFGSNDSDLATGVGPYNQTLTANFTVDQAFLDSFAPSRSAGASVGQFVTARATQNSSVGPKAVSASGTAALEWDFSPSDPSFAGATSIVEMSFSLDEGTNATFFGDAALFVDAILFRQEGGFSFEPWVGSFGPFSEDLFLTAGTYTLLARTAVTGDEILSEGGFPESSFSMTLSIPEPVHALLVALGLLGISAAAGRP